MLPNKLHYFCPGECKGVAEVPKNCDSSSCSFYKLPLQACQCEDGNHNPNVFTYPADVLKS